jgi:hypothetical protein
MTKDAGNARLLGLILAVSLALRVVLAQLGGQYFLGDEPRYHRGIDLWLAASDGRWAEASAILGQPEHAAFVWLGALLTPFQHVLARFAGHGDWTDPGNIYASAGFAAALLGIFSVLSIWLVHRLARSAGADGDEALWAALLAAASNTLFYYSRHLLPYDAALSAWLGALVLTRSSSARARLAGGALAGLTYHLYNGYWFLLPLALAWSLWRPRGEVVRPQLDFGWLLGGAVGFGLPVLVGVACSGGQYWTVARAFSGTVKQGLFSEGWSLPWEYLAHSESSPGFLLVALIALALFLRRGRIPTRVRSWLLLLAGAYGLMVLTSTVLHLFVLYGRTARPLVPLGCLLGGWALHVLTANHPRRPFAAAAVVLLAALNFWPSFTMQFPREIEFDVLRELGNPKSALTFDGCISRPLLLPVVRPGYALVNAQLLYPVRKYTGYPRGEVLLSIPHPLSYAPYQYEGHTPRERRLLRENDIAVKLIRLADPPSVPDHPPPDRLFTAADRPDGYDHESP